MKQTAVEWLHEKLAKSELEDMQTNINIWFQQAKDMEREQRGYSEEEVLELIQFLAEKRDFKKHSSMSIFIAKDYWNVFTQAKEMEKEQQSKFPIDFINWLHLNQYKYNPKAKFYQKIFINETFFFSIDELFLLFKQQEQ